MEWRRLFKPAAVLVVLGYCSLLVYEGGVTFVTFNSQISRPTSDEIAFLSIEPVTKINESLNKNITVEDVYITVKTSINHQYTRLPTILKTWFQLAPKQIWFFTDTDNSEHQKQTNGHMINTMCGTTHRRSHLCCKTSQEYNTFMRSGKKWWCHFDDDNYVNVPKLVTVLQRYNPMKDWYLGRTSISKPVTLWRGKKKRVKFWFGTGGAGYCITRSLGLKMLPIASGGKFISTCEKVSFPDDVTMGYIIGHKIKRKLTFVPELHSHLEAMKLLSPETLKDQVSVSYSQNIKSKNDTWNVVNVPGLDVKQDPTRFLSLHCFLFPDFEFCPR